MERSEYLAGVRRDAKNPHFSFAERCKLWRAYWRVRFMSRRRWEQQQATFAEFERLFNAWRRMFMDSAEKASQQPPPVYRRE